MQLASIDIAIIIVYLIAIVLIGIFSSRKIHGEDELFLAGRSLGVYAVGLSLFASNISSTTLIGLAGDAYDSGIAVYNYEWMAAFILVIMAIFVFPYYIRSRVSTVPEYLEKRYNPFVRKYLSIVTIVLSIGVDTAGGIYAGALVLKAFFPDLIIWQVCIALAVFAGLYTAFGGLRAVVYTDMVQSVVLLIGSSILTYLVFEKLDFSWDAIQSKMPEGHLSLFKPLDDKTLPWLGTLLGLPILGFYYWSMNQYIVQRALGARNLETAQKGALFAGFLKLAPLFIMVLPGSMAYILLPDLPNKDLVFPTMIIKYLPAVLTGLVLSGLLAAIMSSIDSSLNSASTLVTLDFISAKKPGLNHQQLGRIGRVVTLCFMALAAAWAPMIENFPGLFAYLQTAFSYIVPPLVAIFVLGYFSKKVHGRAAIAALLAGHGISAVCFVLVQSEIFYLHFTIMAFLLLAVTMVTQLVFSIFISDQPAAGNDFTFERAYINLSMKNKNIRIMIALLLAIMILILVVFK